MVKPAPPYPGATQQNSKPTHTLSVRRGNTTKVWHIVGAGWINEFGAITIKLNPMIDLSRLVEGDTLRLFPKDYNMKKGATEDGPLPPDFGDDDVPF